MLHVTYCQWPPWPRCRNSNIVSRRLYKPLLIGRQDTWKTPTCACFGVEAHIYYFKKYFLNKYGYLQTIRYGFLLVLRKLAWAKQAMLDIFGF